MKTTQSADKFFMANKGLIIHDGQALILHESNTNPDGTQIGKYGIPGSRLNPGEHFMDALKREIREECGLDVEVIEPLLRR